MDTHNAGTGDKRQCTKGRKNERELLVDVVAAQLLDERPLLCLCPLQGTVQRVQPAETETKREHGNSMSRWHEGKLQQQEHTLTDQAPLSSR